MTLLVKILVWLALAVLLCVGVLILDVRRAVAKAGRVSIQSESQAAAIIARFPFEPSYFGRVVDEVPKTDWLILLDLFPRHSQLVLVKKLGWLDDRQKASLVATHVTLLDRSGRLAAGLDRAAKTWLNIPLENATLEQLDQLAVRQRQRGKSKSAAIPSSRPAVPAPAGVSPR